MQMVAKSPKQQPIADQDVLIFPRQEKFLENISSFRSSTMKKKLIIVVSSFSELNDASLFIYFDIKLTVGISGKRLHALDNVDPYKQMPTIFQ